MSVLDHLGERRKRDSKFIAFVRMCANIAARDRDTQSSAMFMSLLEEMRIALTVRGCTFEHLQTAMAQCCPPRDSSILDPLPDEPTRPDTPMAKPVSWP